MGGYSTLVEGMENIPPDVVAELSYLGAETLVAGIEKREDFSSIGSPGLTSYLFSEEAPKTEDPVGLILNIPPDDEELS